MSIHYQSIDGRTYTYLGDFNGYLLSGAYTAAVTNKLSVQARQRFILRFLSN